VISDDVLARYTPGKYCDVYVTLVISATLLEDAGKKGYSVMMLMTGMWPFNWMSGRM
jgi:hypothetical protein